MSQRKQGRRIERTLQPEKHLAHLRANIPKLEELPHEKQARLSYMAWVGGSSKQFRHKKHPDAFFLPSRLRDQWFGRGRFPQINKQLGLFKVGSGYSKTEATTKPYLVTKKAQAIVGDYLESVTETSTDLITATGRYIKKPPKNGAIYCRDNKGSVAKKRFEMRWAIPVNVPNIANYLAHLEAPDDLFLETLTHLEEEPRKWLGMQIRALQRIIKLQRNTVTPFETIPLVYVETPAGRLQGQAFHLQNLPREVRNAALAGCWDYDIENCHFTIFAQLAQQHGYECQAVTQYMRHKALTRKAIAREVGITPGQVKTCLLALLYGAVRSESWRAAIPNEIGRRCARKLYRNTWFQTLHEEVRTGRAVILKAQYVFRDRIKNTLGKCTSAKEKPEKRLAHLLQGIEADMLNVVGELHGESLVLLMHDGFVSDKRLDVAGMEHAILKETGFTVMFEERHLPEFSDHKVEVVQVIEYEKKTPSPSSFLAH